MPKLRNCSKGEGEEPTTDEGGTLNTETAVKKINRPRFFCLLSFCDPKIFPEKSNSSSCFRFTSSRSTPSSQSNKSINDSDGSFSLVLFGSANLNITIIICLFYHYNNAD